MTAIWVLIWVVGAALAYLCTEGVALCCSKDAWDRPTREFAIVCSLLLGPIYLLIAAELLLLAAMGKGLSSDMPQRYKH